VHCIRPLNQSSGFIGLGKIGMPIHRFRRGFRAEPIFWIQPISKSMDAQAQLPGYELVEALGGGPITAVYAARELADGSACAIKLIRPEWEDQPVAIKLLQREARAGLAVRHPHLVRLLDVHVTRPPYFLVMELLAGESLRRRLEREHRLKLPAVVWILRQTTAALAAIHRAGFVHGDIKPDNVHLVDGGTAKLIDLGFAHRPGENAAFREQGYLLGTADYLAPELCATDAEVDERADLFSLGVMFFEMLAGQLPYASGNARQTLKHHRDDPPADIRRHTEALPTVFVKLLDRLLAHYPHERPRAAAVAQQLGALELSFLRRTA
jgi:serine/threonine protein kinase